MLVKLNNKNILLSIFVILQLFIGQVFAQAAPPTTGGLVTNANSTTKPMISGIEMLKSLFGPDVADPMSMLNATGGAAGGTVLGQMFAIFNLALMALAGIFVTYTILASIVQTAHEGEFIGQRYDTVWMPIRIATGVFSMIPAFKGWCLAQVLMIWFAVMGVGIGNMVWEAAVTGIMAQGGLVTPPPPPASVDLARDVFRMNLCVAAANEGITIAGVNAAPFAAATYADANKNGGTAYGQNGDSTCGAVMYPGTWAQMNGSVIPTTGGASQAAAASKRAYETLNTAAATKAQEVAKAVAATLTAGMNGGGNSVAPIPDMNAIVNTLAATYQTSYQQQMIAAQSAIDAASKSASNALMALVQDQAKTTGFTSAGAWYMVLAQYSTQVVNDLNVQVKVIKQPAMPNAPIFAGLNNVYAKAFNQYIANSQSPTGGSSGAMVGTGGGGGDGDAQVIAKAKDAMGCGVIGGGLGQCMASKIIGTQMPAPGQSASMLVVLKNIGDVASSIGLLLIGVAGTIKHTIEAAIDGSANVPIFGALFGAAGGAIGGAALTYLDLFETALKAFIYFCLSLSTYLPMVPFIIWIGALGSWLAVVVEAVIAAPLWALTHLDGEGQGMGQRTTQGYLFIVNVLFRPALMVFGFILAALMVDILGRYLFEMYRFALGAAQAESITGIIAFLCFVGIFMLTGLSIVNVAFNMIHVVPDNVLGWLGGQLQNSLGRGVEDHVNSKTGGAITGIGSTARGRYRGDSREKVTLTPDPNRQAQVGGNGATKTRL